MEAVTSLNRNLYPPRIHSLDRQWAWANKTLQFWAETAQDRAHQALIKELSDS